MTTSRKPIAKAEDVHKLSPSAADALLGGPKVTEKADDFYDDISAMRKIVNNIFSSHGIETVPAPAASAFAAQGSVTPSVAPPNKPVWEDAEPIDFDAITRGFKEHIAAEYGPCAE
jgi:hypothetical protein